MCEKSYLTNKTTIYNPPSGYIILFKAIPAVGTENTL